MAAHSRRVTASFTEREHAALSDLATELRAPLAAVLARIIRAHLATGDAAHLAPAPPTQAGTTTPAWLPPGDREARGDWARARAAAVQSLLDRYPRELSALGDAWPKDAAVREQLWALTVWRDLLDSGTYDDPRMELAFAAALADFAGYLRDRGRTLTRPAH